MTEQRKKKIALRCQQIVEAINKETDNGTIKVYTVLLRVCLS